jgi:nitroimidazol reductase NimA-like FMN-containing flavoprotein (pyridoxamine 5'-phosphate oxidase superfamily)
MIEKMKQIVRDEKYCVLATAMNNRPHCSLMAYVVGEDCKRLYMVTYKDSDKYRNLQTNDSVSLMIDTRANSKDKSAKALTVTGRFIQIDDEKTLCQIKKELIKHHPGLEVFLNNESSCVFAIEIESFLLLDGFTDSYFEKLT